MSRDPQLGVYIHWPWCLSKCPYCDFNSQAVDPKAIDQEFWRNALFTELDRSLDETSPQRVGSVFFGGGTPSLMGAGTVEALLNLLAKRRPLSAKLEVTLEANPGTLTAKALDGFKSAGVTRLSLGVQALDNQALKQLGRIHDVKSALKAVDLIRKRFDYCSLDLIYGRPGQSLEAWRAELAQALALGLGHYSLYQLTYESSTPLGRAVSSGRIAPLDSDAEAAFYRQTLAQMAEAGRPSYEISNFAAKGHACRHNTDIWQGGTYIGIGPGAHGRERRGSEIVATERLADPQDWARQVMVIGHGYKTSAALLPGERAHELILLGLRLTEGIDRKRFERLTGFDLLEVLDPLAVRRLVKDGYIHRSCETFRATTEGRLLLDSITRILLTG